MASKRSLPSSSLKQTKRIPDVIVLHYTMYNYNMDGSMTVLKWLHSCLHCLWMESWMNEVGQALQCYVHLSCILNQTIAEPHTVQAQLFNGWCIIPYHNYAYIIVHDPDYPNKQQMFNINKVIFALVFARVGVIKIDCNRLNDRK